MSQRLPVQQIVNTKKLTALKAIYQNVSKRSNVRVENTQYLTVIENYEVCLETPSTPLGYLIYIRPNYTLLFWTLKVWNKTLQT